MLADVRTSDEEFEQPGGLVRGEEGSERRVRGTYRRGLDGHYSGEINGGVTPATVSRSGERGRRLREEGDDTRGPHGREGRGQRVTVWGWAMLGRGWLLGLGRKASRGPFFIFFFSKLLFFFYFLIPFIDFARMFQISSNHFQKFCKNHSKVLIQ
jgi:hypothetical protein